MSWTIWMATAVVIATIYALIKRYETRLVLLTAGFLMALLSMKPMMAFQQFDKSMTAAALIIAICSAIGFASVISITKCDLHLVSLLTKPLKQFGIFDKAKSMVGELSGGQRQKLFIVLALIPQPKVVFLDELTTGLDAKARREVWKILSDLKEKGLTIFLTSHFMDEVEALCDTICILKKGKAVFYGTVKEAIAGSPYDKFEDAYLWYSDEEVSNNESI